MLRKRTRSFHKDRQMGHPTVSDSPGSESYYQSDVLGHSYESYSCFSVPGLLIGLSPNGLSDSESVRSPTSPLDIRVFSNLGKSSRSPRSLHKNWDSNKVGLSIIHSLDGDAKISGEVDLIPSSESKKILHGPQMRTKPPNFERYINSFEAPKSLPKSFAISPHSHLKSPLYKGSSDVIFEIGETLLKPESFGKIRSCSLDSCQSFPVLSGFTDHRTNMSSGNFCSWNKTSQVSSPQLIGGSANSNIFSHIRPNSMSVSIDSGSGYIDSLSASEIELSEDYTRVISHGPNPKTTHIFGDCILKCHSGDSSNYGKNEGNEFELSPSDTSSASLNPSDDFLSFCYSCSKKLEGKDIYIYRGEKAFCSLNCRSHEILIDEEIENSNSKPSENSPKSDDGEELFEPGILVVT
ncbi:DUF581 domain-containing protein [Cephalotus follicularis]|uniref:DUF581 domain-containing protein n=1 Tax=Cephalotus follicularis TaxID=3775 RepID=A0A1Q3C6U0_CEPFO|nr:DUF581 domain-containing protein [Cephalotus follicularis]